MNGQVEYAKAGDPMPGGTNGMLLLHENRLREIEAVSPLMRSSFEGLLRRVEALENKANGQAHRIEALEAAQVRQGVKNDDAI